MGREWEPEAGVRFARRKGSCAVRGSARLGGRRRARAAVQWGQTGRVEHGEVGTRGGRKEGRHTDQTHANAAAFPKAKGRCDSPAAAEGVCVLAWRTSNGACVWERGRMGAPAWTAPGLCACQSETRGQVSCRVSSVRPQRHALCPLGECTEARGAQSGGKGAPRQPAAGRPRAAARPQHETAAAPAPVREGLGAGRGPHAPWRLRTGRRGWPATRATAGTCTRGGPPGGPP
jgi:hypothetical protein